MASTPAVAMMTVLLLGGAGAALQPQLALPDIDEALRLARTAFDRERTRFHGPYRITVATAPVDYIDVVTPFRRIVLAAEERAARGDRNFTQRAAVELLKAEGDLVDLHVELTFHPLNTLIGVPDYTVTLVDRRGRRVEPATIDRLSRWTPRVAGQPPAVPATGSTGPPPSGPLLGATVIARFGVGDLDPEGNYEVRVGERAGELARVRIDFGKLR